MRFGKVQVKFSEVCFFNLKFFEFQNRNSARKTARQLPEELHVVLVEFDAVETLASRVQAVNTMQRDVSGAIPNHVGHLESLDSQSTRGYFCLNFNFGFFAADVQKAE